MDYREKRYCKITNELLPRPAVGKGLVNTLINKLPIELHVPTYEFLGPGTKLERKLRKGVEPKNELDRAAMYHDIAYARSNNIADRHAADYKLQEDAWKRVLSKDADLGEKATAWFVANTMKAKRALGAGLPKYTRVPVSLQDSEKERLAAAVAKKKSVTLKVSRLRTKESVMNETYLPLTKYQVTRLNKTGSVKLSVRQLEHIKNGGFLPALIAAAPAAAAVGTLLSSLYSAYSSKKHRDALLEEQMRHNRALEPVAVTTTTTAGQGVYINKKPRQGRGVYINKKPPKYGNGLLEQLLAKKKKSLR